MSADGSPQPKLDDLSTLLRERFWRVDPLGIAEDVEFTWSEYHDIADSAAQRAADGEESEAIAQAVIREFREDWGIDHPEETARAVAESVELYRRRPAVVAAGASGGRSQHLDVDLLQEIGDWVMRARPDRVTQYEVHELTPVDPRRSLARLEVFPVNVRQKAAVVTVVNGGIVLVTTGAAGYSELELDDDLPQLIDEITSELLRVFPVRLAPSADLERLGGRIREELGGLGLIHVEIPDPLLPALTMDVMAYGRRLGLLLAGTAVSASLWRHEAGLPVTADEQRIAFALSEELRDVDDWLDGWDIAPARREACERFWVAMTFHALLLAWRAPAIDAELVADMDAAWGEETTFSRTIRRSRRFFRRDSWLRRHLEADLSAEMSALARPHLTDGDPETPGPT